MELFRRVQPVTMRETLGFKLHGSIVEHVLEQTASTDRTEEFMRVTSAIIMHALQS
jgi:hypothetical protein